MSRNPGQGSRGEGARVSPNGVSPGIATILLLACLALGSSLLAFILSPRGEAREGSWRGYLTLLLEDSIPEEDALSALTAAGFRNVVSASTEPVLVSNWIGLETLPLGEALGRLVKGDPRRDGYVESLASWFSTAAGGKSYRIYYIPSSSPQLAAKKLAKALEPFRDKAILPDAFGPSDRSPQASGGGAIGLIFALLVISTASVLGALRDAKLPRSRFASRLAARLAIGVPWIITSGAGLPMAAVACLWALASIDGVASLDLPLAEYIRTGSIASAFDSLKRQALPPLAILGSALIASFLAPQTIPAGCMALLGSLAGLGTFASVARATRPGEARALFVPKPISSPGRSWAAASPWSAGLACLAVVFWLAGLRGAALPSGLARGGAAIAFPRPFAVEGSARPGLVEARKRAAASEKGRLPDLSAWLEHRALQEALPYERVGSPRADPFGPVAVSRPGGEAVPLRFDEDWARGAYKTIPTTSVEGMLLAQGGSVAAFALPGSAGSGKGRPLAPIEVLRYIFLLIPPLGRIAAGLRAQRGSGANETRQEA